MWGTPPTLTLNTGSHYEAGAADAVAVFIGGGYGEKKRFWKNNEANPLGRGAEAQQWSQDAYEVDDGGCTLQNARLLPVGSSLCARLVQSTPAVEVDAADTSHGASTVVGGCSCAAFSGITREANATLFTRRIHTIAVGDLVIVQGVTVRAPPPTVAPHAPRQCRAGPLSAVGRPLSAVRCLSAALLHSGLAVSLATRSPV